MTRTEFLEALRGHDDVVFGSGSTLTTPGHPTRQHLAATLTEVLVDGDEIVFGVQLGKVGSEKEPDSEKTFPAGTQAWYLLLKSGMLLEVTFAMRSGGRMLGYSFLHVGWLERAQLELESESRAKTAHSARVTLTFPAGRTFPAGGTVIFTPNDDELTVAALQEFFVHVVRAQSATAGSRT